LYEQLSGNTTAAYHNSKPRNKDLGTITAGNRDAWVQTYVNGGSFEAFVGDEVTIQDGTYNAKWLVAGCDTELNKGDTALTTHHVSLIPKTPLFSARMNSSNTTAGGVKGSEMVTSTLPALATTLKSALGNRLLERRVLYSNAVDTSAVSQYSKLTGMASGWELFSAYCSLLSEVQVYGSMVFGGPYDVGEASQQLPIFKFINFINYSRFGFWLRGVASSADFCYADGYGGASSSGASTSAGVRPLITVG
jgi:hypothetical protein